MGIYQSEYWLSDSWGMNRSERMSGSYHPYLPDKLCEAQLNLTPEAASAVAQAQMDIINLNASSTHLSDTEPLARLILRAEALASSKIEGLAMNAGKLLEYEALDELGVPHRIDSTEAAVLGNISAMHGAIDEVASSSVMTVEAICSINQRLLEHTNLADYGGVLRNEQNWIGGNNVNPIGAAYVPPKPEYVPELMEDLARFVNEAQLPPVAVASLVHAQLETIHPFADGNGRTGRALTHTLLKRFGLVRHTIPPVSLVLATDKTRYISNLEAFRVDNENPTHRPFAEVASDWIEYFSRSISLACTRATEFEDTISAIQMEWQDRAKVRARSTAALLIEKLPGNPVVSIASAARLTGRSREAARNALIALAEAGILRQNARNKKSNLYVATDIIRAFTGYERALATPGGDTLAQKPLRPVPQRRPR